MVEVWTATDLGLADLAPDTELGGLILGPERVRGQVTKGTPGSGSGVGWRAEIQADCLTRAT